MSRNDVFDTVIVRFSGEIGVKASWTRRRTELRLLKNIKLAMKTFNTQIGEISRSHSRIVAKTDNAEEAATKMSNIFGVSSTSPASETTSNLDNIVEASLRLSSLDLRRGESLAVKCRRTGRHAYNSMDVCRRVGSEILEKLQRLNLKVDLKKPDFTLGIEVRGEKAYVYDRVVEGVGGFPVGTQPCVIGLLNDSVNSLLACWMVMKRGCRVIPVYMELPSVTSEETKRQTMKNADLLFKYSAGFPRKVYVENSNSEKEWKEASRILRLRTLYRIAVKVATEEKAEGIVTGEMLNGREGSSLDLICMLNDETRGIPVYRPLIGLDTVQVKEMARKIFLDRTFELNIVRSNTY